MIEKQHRAARALVRVLAVTCLVLGLISQSVIQFVSSADKASETVGTLVANDEFRRLIADEIVERAEEKNSDPAQRLLFVVARTSIANLVVDKLQDPRMADLISDVVHAAYRVYVDGEQIVSVDISRFGDIARAAISAVDSRLSTDVSVNFEPLRITRSNNSPDFGHWINVVKLLSWFLIFIGLSALALGWRLTPHHRGKQIQFVGGVFATSAIAIAGLVFVARAIAPQFSDEYRGVIAVVSDFVTNPALIWALICGAVGLLCLVVSLAMGRQAVEQP